MPIPGVKSAGGEFKTTGELIEIDGIRLNVAGTPTVCLRAGCTRTLAPQRCAGYVHRDKFRNGIPGCQHTSCIVIASLVLAIVYAAARPGTCATRGHFHIHLRQKYAGKNKPAGEQTEKQAQNDGRGQYRIHNPSRRARRAVSGISARCNGNPCWSSNRRLLHSSRGSSHSRRGRWGGCCGWRWYRSW